jgi:hypothetical protein
MKYCNQCGKGVSESAAVCSKCFGVSFSSAPIVRQEEKARRQAEIAARPVNCPNCGATQITAQKHGFGGLKALAGLAVVGPVGLLAGIHGSRKIDLTCLKCGHSWTAN